jgi:phosphoenolpyruvate-protein phosphotransferase
MTLLLKQVVLQGISVSSGIGIGKAHLFSCSKEHFPKRVTTSNLDGEIRRYRNAVDASIHDLLELQNQLKKENAFEGIKVLDTHLELLADPMMTSNVVQEMKRSKKNGLAVLHRTVLEYRHKFAAIKDPFFQERFLDIQDVSDRVMNHLKRKVHLGLSHLPRGSILFAEDLTPSEVATLKLGNIAGIVTKRGGLTSHVAIIAKSRGIPYVAHLDFTKIKFPHDALIVIDGRKGEVIVDPEPETLLEYDHIQKRQTDFQRQIQIGESLAPCTEDGCSMRLYLNVNHPNEIEAVTEDWDGIGLFRTEFLISEALEVPTEEKQFSIYKELIEKFPDKPCAIRVFDVGGEKASLIPEQAHEHNPSLGFRAIRFLLLEETIFKNQVRALLRASIYGDVRILLPMITTIEELRESRKRVEEIKDELHREGYPTRESIPVGCMVEVPSAALIADHLASESDFLSFGTNDLVQYTLAVDRSNHLVSTIYSPFHPGLIRLLKHVIREALKKQVPISICGEIGSDPRYTPLLIGLGLRELSLSKNSYGMIKHVIRKSNMKQCRALAKKALMLTTSEEIESLLTHFYKGLVPDDDRFTP